MSRSRLKADENLFGFYLSREGRDFLRELLPALSARMQFGDGKIASIIADGNASDPLAEVDRTKAALRRWRNGQSELWLDKRKNERHLRRLERLLMSVTECREILEDQARTKEREDTGSSLALFFYGRDSIKDHFKMVDNLSTASLLQRINITFSKSRVTHSNTSHYFALMVAKDKPFLLCQEVFVVNKHDWTPNSGLANHYSGFAYLSAGKIHRLMSHKHTGHDRLIDTLTNDPPASLRHNLHLDISGAAELRYLLNDYKSLFQNNENTTAPTFPKPLSYDVYRPVNEAIGHQILTYLLKQPWDIVL